MQGCAEAHGEDAVDSPYGFWFLIPGFLCYRVCCTWVHFLFSWRQVDTCSIVSELPERFGCCQAHVGPARSPDPILLYRL